MGEQDMDDVSVTVLRRADMAFVEITLENLTRVDAPDGASALVPTNRNEPGKLVIGLPPQAILEQVFIPGQLRPAPLCQALFSGASTLVFQVQPAATPLPFTAAGLLSWTGLIPITAKSTVEAIFGLLLRPAFWPNDVWVNATDAVASRRSDGAFALWHTTLMVRDGHGRPNFNHRGPLPLVAYLSGAAEPNPRFDTPLGAPIREAISAASRAVPLAARQVILSPLGATVELAGQWPPGGPGGLVSYRHRSVLGRDQSVQTVTRGYLLPFGFHAILTETTDRTGHTNLIDAGHDGAAFLVKTTTLDVINPVITYPGTPGLPDQGRSFPFRAVHLDAPLSVQLKKIDNSIAPGVTWLNQPGGDESVSARFLFDLSAEDYAGNVVSFRAPMYFINEDTAVTPGGRVGAAAMIYDAEQRGIPRPAAARIALAIDAITESLIDIKALYFGAQPAGPGVGAGARLAAFPRLAGLDARIPAIDAFTATRPPAPAGPGPQLVLTPKYLRAGFGPSGVYAQLNRPQAFLPPPRAAGGLATLNVNVVGLSRSCGLVGGAAGAQAEALDEGFKPEKFFPPTADPTGYLPPKLLGFIDLAALVAPVPAGDGEKVPRVATEVITQPGAGGADVPVAVRSTVTWRPAIRADASSGILHPTPQTTLDLRCVTTLDLHGGAPVTEVRGDLRAFNLSFLDGLLTVVFDRLTFTSHAGALPALDAKIAAITPFAASAEKGGLAFFADLLALLPNTANGPRILHTADSITAEYSIALPSASMGVFMMQELAIIASVTVPLNGKPIRARFAISSREDPFLLTVSLFGGGGFLALEVEGEEIKQLEAQLEFAAATSLDLLVASASVAVTAGIYLRIDGKAVHTEGFFRAVGELDVLGAVSVSVEIYLSLSFETDPPPKRFIGRAEVTVRVRVLCLSKALTIPVTRSFGGGNDPAFDATFPTPDPWSQHCAAFAAMEAP